MKKAIFLTVFSFCVMAVYGQYGYTPYVPYVPYVPYNYNTQPNYSQMWNQIGEGFRQLHQQMEFQHQQSLQSLQAQWDYWASMLKNGYIPNYVPALEPAPSIYDNPSYSSSSSNGGKIGPYTVDEYAQRLDNAYDGLQRAYSNVLSNPTKESMDVLNGERARVRQLKNLR
ncbi:MAG: hypothetical protein LBH57_10065 [Treponema sp.]|jgi:hypothetical protein|nr:hypothetical protein [Treponema sp.]